MVLPWTTHTTTWCYLWQFFLRQFSCLCRLIRTIQCVSATSKNKHIRTLVCLLIHCSTRYNTTTSSFCGSVVSWLGRWTCNREIASSTPCHCIAGQPRSTQPSIHPGYVNRVPACQLGLRRDAFTCVGWQVTLCDPIRQVTSHSSRTSSRRGLYLAYTQTHTYTVGHKNGATVSFEITSAKTDWFQ